MAAATGAVGVVEVEIVAATVVLVIGLATALGLLPVPKTCASATTSSYVQRGSELSCALVYCIQVNPRMEPVTAPYLIRAEHAPYQHK